MFNHNSEESRAVVYLSFAMGHFSGDFAKMELVVGEDSKVKYLVNEKIVDAMPLSDKIRTKYLDKVIGCGVLEWEEEYIDPEVSDGIQWELDIRFEDGSTIERYGSNKYPDNWKKFMKCINGLDIPDFK